MINYAKNYLPFECCGIIAGKYDYDKKIIQKIYFTENSEKRTDHFFIDPSDELKVILDIRKNNLKLLGNFHSHPCSVAKMSDEDLKFATDENLSYMIISLKDKPIINSFIVKNNICKNEHIKILY